MAQWSDAPGIGIAVKITFHSNDSILSFVNLLINMKTQSYIISIGDNVGGMGIDGNDFNLQALREL